MSRSRNVRIVVGSKSVRFEATALVGLHADEAATAASGPRSPVGVYGGGGARLPKMWDQETSLVGSRSPVGLTCWLGPSIVLGLGLRAVPGHRAAGSRVAGVARPGVVDQLDGGPEQVGRCGGALDARQFGQDGVSAVGGD